MMNGIDRRTLLAGFGGLMTLMRSPAAATPSGRAARLPVRLQDLPVIDARSRRRLSLVRDIMGGRVVILNFMFLGCSTVCPIQSQLLSRAQRLLGSRMGNDVVFASMTMNPIGDTPARLAAYADENSAGPGWHFLNADFDAVGRLRQGFDSYSTSVADHPPVFYIGRATSNRWSRLYGMPRPEIIANEVKGWLSA